MVRSAGTTERVEEQLAPIFSSVLRQELGKRTFQSLLTAERGQAMLNIREGLDREAREYGAQVIDVRIKRADLPDGTPLESAFARMSAAREQEAITIIAQGRKNAQIILATAEADAAKTYAESFGKAPNISVDYAIFEKTRLIAMIPVSFFWSDLGSWDAVWKVSDKDGGNNAVMGDATLSNTTNSFVLSEKAHVAVEGLDDVAVIATEDAVYVGKLSEAQKVGAMVKSLKLSPATQGITEIHRTAYRPWGGYSSVLSGARFQVKRLFVKPGKKLSLQKHHHRAEHWIVVSGTAEVTIDGKVTMLSENQSIYLPLGCVHRLANPGKILLELIEVQTGSYLGEDDIIRIEDEFGRA